ncbi:hypothetical protein MYX84_13425 [Acidobacteria bacterium AH-259-O06]|nr:hypothetical protein [Acidobacteria bacterium AH-259-O06]
MYWRMMLLAFLANGLAVFGFRVLADHQLTEQYKNQYLIIWYAFACIVATAIFLRSNTWPLRREIIIGGIMGVSSIVGLLSMATALGYGMAGLVVFPVTIGGSLFWVAAFGITWYKEKVGRYGYIGIIVGIIAVIVLSLP